MLKSNKKRIQWLLLITLVCSSCSVSFMENRPTPITIKSWRCDLPPLPYQASDLSGTWQTDFRSTTGSREDILILEDDGKYKQIFSNNETNYRYESGWQDWWVEIRESGGSYVHFTGMKYCGGVSGVCISPQDIELGFYDFCEDQWLDLSGEFLLAVVGDPAVPGSIRFRHMKPPGYDTFNVNYIKVGN